MLRTLPRQLFLYLVPGMLLVLAVAGWSLDKLVDDQLTAYFDTTLNAKARAIVALTEQDEDGVELEVYADALPEFSQSSNPDYFHVINRKGETLFLSPSALKLKNQLPVFQSDDSARRLSSEDSRETEIKHIDHVLPDGRSGRWAIVSYYPRIDPDDDEEPSAIPSETAVLEDSLNTELTATNSPVMVNGVLIIPERVSTYVGVSRTSLDQLMWIIDLILILTGAAIAAAIVLIAGIGIKRAIAPLNRLSNDIAAVDERSLDTRIMLSKPVAELDVVVDQFNHLLERLKSAFNRERQFSADVAHELRTPIAEMRSMIEVHARFPEDALLAAEFSESLLASTERVQRLVEQLLALSRTELGVLDIGDSIDLVGYLESHTHAYREKARTQGMDLVIKYNTPVVIVSGSNIWPMILVNVFDNAISHSSGLGDVVVNLDADGSSFSLSVSNPCGELQEEDLPHIFDRLWTKDTSRTESSHSGLGLSLVEAYAELLALNCDVSIAPASGVVQGHSRFTITLKGTYDSGHTQSERPAKAGM